MTLDALPRGGMLAVMLRRRRGWARLVREEQFRSLDAVLQSSAGHHGAKAKEKP